MASGGSSLRFSVVVAADQAEQALKSLTTAFNQAGVSAKTSLAGIAPAARQASSAVVSTSRSVSQFKEHLSRSRESAMFFTQSLGEFGPAGRTAQIAISGLTGALMGGGALLVALSAVQAAVRLFVQESKEEAEASEKAAEAARERAKAYAQTRAELERLRYVQSGGVGEVVDAAKANAEAVAAVNAARQAVESARAAFNQAKALIPAARGLADEEAAKYYSNLRALYAAVQSATEQLAAAEANRAAVAEIGSRKAAAAIDSETEAARRRAEAEIKGSRVEISSATAGVGDRTAPTVSVGEFIQPEDVERAEQDRLRSIYRANEAIAEGKRLTAEHNAEVARGAAAAQQWGNAIGAAFGQMATGQMATREGIIAIMQMTIREATGYAIAAAINAGKSQAGIPVVGPVLAISAAGAVLSAMMGMMASMPSARGGWDVPAGYNGLAMIHEREMVLPQEQADIIRSGGGGGITVNVGGAIISDRDLEQTLTSRNGGLARAQRKMQRRRRG